MSKFAAAQVAVQTCVDAAGDLREVHFVLFGGAAHQAFCEAAEKHAAKAPADDATPAQATAAAAPKSYA